MTNGAEKTLATLIASWNPMMGFRRQYYFEPVYMKVCDAADEAYQCVIDKLQSIDRELCKAMEGG